jgi:hydrogenase expression/formation protein HypC
MCLGIPMKIIKIEGDKAIVKTDGLKREANISLIKNPKVGEYIMIHAGFAIEKIKESEAKKTLKALKSIKI